MVVFVVQPEDHGGVSGERQQDVGKLSQAIPPERMGLVDHRLGVVQFAVGRCEYAVPEQSDLFFQGTPRVNDAVQPIALAALQQHQAVLVHVVAPDQVFHLQIGLILGMQ